MSLLGWHDKLHITENSEGTFDVSYLGTIGISVTMLEICLECLSKSTNQIKIRIPFQTKVFEYYF